MKKNRRLVGIDLFKGIAAYAVVFIHSSGGPFGPTNFWAAKIVQFFVGFAVPFFLATSFYLMIKKIYSSDTPYSFNPRLKLLLVPYLIWTVIYLISRSAKYLEADNYQKISNLFSDPVSLIFFGSAAVQLYFLPLLIAGTVATQFILIFLPKKMHLNIIICLIIFTTLIYEKILNSGNDFNLNGIYEVAFNNFIKSNSSELNNNQLIRLILVELSWIFRCLPYIFISILLNNPFFSKKISQADIKYTIVFLILAFAINASVTFGKPILPFFVSEICIAYFSLLFSLSLSNQIAENYLITNLGICSFGIYLIHELAIDIVRPMVYKIYPGCISVITVTTCSVISFLLSWLVVSYLRKYAKLRNLLFGG